MLYFATYFDSNYLNRGLVLFESLSRTCSRSVKLFILALDDKVIKYFKQHPDECIELISINEIEKHFPELKEIKKTRSLIEYYFTLSPFLPLYILEKFSFVDNITTLDSDIYFFADVQAIFNTYKDSSILITPHNFSEKLKSSERFGKYNVSFQSFKNDAFAKACLNDWKQKCSEWCFDYYDEDSDRFADQKYLDEWPQKFKNLEVIAMPGAGLAPWNIDNFHLSKRSNTVYINNEPLIFYHYHGLRIVNNHLAFPNLSNYGARFNKTLKNIYYTYLLKIKEKSKKISDNGIVRNNDVHKKPLLNSIVETNDVLHFNNYFAHHINVRPLYLKFLGLSNKFHGSINRFKNLYRRKGQFNGN